MSDAFTKEVATTVNDVADQIDLIALETNDSVLIKYISNVVLGDDFVAVVHDDRCSFFDRTGKYLHRIARRGDGPEEYLQIQNLYIDNGLVYIFDGAKKRLLTYTMQGDFVNAVGIHNRVRYLLLAGDTFVGFIPNESGQEPLRIIIMDKAGTAIDSIPYTTRHPNENGIRMIYYNGDPHFHLYDGLPNIKELYGDTVFVLNAERELTPRYVIHLGGDSPKMADRYIYNPRQQPLSGKRYLNQMWESPRFLFLCGRGFDDNKSDGFLIYDKETGKAKYTHIQYTASEQELFDKKYFTPRFMSPDNKILISSETPVMGDNEKEEDNPVIVLLHLKE
jgi:hypothetical protein